MAITYDAPSNKITITGYTEGSPCTFQLIYDENVAQGWGVVHKQGANQFLLDCNLRIETWLTDTKKCITFDAGSNTCISVAGSGVFKLGLLSAEGVGYDGCALKVLNATAASGSPCALSGNGRYLFYDTKISGDAGAGRLDIRSSSAENDLIDCIVGDYYLLAWKGSGKLKRVTVHDSSLYGAFIIGTLGDLSNLTIQKCSEGIRFNPNVGNSTFVNPVTREITNNNIGVYSNANASILYLINPELEAWNISWGVLATNAIIYRQYTFNLKVLDKDGNNINGATVNIWDKDDNLLVDTTTTAGVIAEQTLSYGYYDRAHGSVLQSYSPHKIQIRKAGTNYLTYEKKFILNEKINWRIAMVDMTDLLNELSDIKGTGFVKDTHSLTKIKKITDLIRALIS